MEVNPNEFGLSPELSPEPTGKKHWLIGLIVTLLIISSAVYAYVSLDVFKNNKQIYAEIEVKNFNQVKEKISNIYNTYYENYIGKYLENPVQEEMELSMSLQGIDTGDPNMNKVLDLLQKSKLIVTTKQEQKKEYAYASLDWAIENNNIVGVEYLVDKTKLAFKVPAFYDKYVVFDLKERDILEQKFGMQDLPKKLMLSEDFYDAFKLTPKEAKVFYAYGRLYLDSIEEKQITMTKGTFSEGDFKVDDCRVMTITFNSNDEKELEKKFREKLTQDEDLVNLIYNKWDNLYKLFEEAGYPMDSGEFNKLSKEQIREGLKSFAEEETEAEVPEGFKMVLYIDQDDHILERCFLPLDETKSPEVIRCASWIDQGKDNWLFLMKGIENDPGELRITHQGMSLQENEKKGTLVVSFKGSEPSESMEWKNDYSYKSDETKEVGEWKFAVNYAQMDMVSGEIKTDIDKNAKENSKKGVTKASLCLNNIPEESLNNATINLEVKHSEIIGKKFEHVKLNEATSVNLAKATQAQLAAIMQEVQNKAQQFMLENQALIAQFGL